MRALFLSGATKPVFSNDRMKSILSSEHVIDISKRHLTARYLSHVDPPRERHPAGAQRLGLALANLNGIDYGSAMRRAHP